MSTTLKVKVRFISRHYYCITVVYNSQHTILNNSKGNFNIKVGRNVMSWSLAGNRIAGTRYRETLWWEAQELSEHMRSVPILVTAIKTHQTTLQTLQIITGTWGTPFSKCLPIYPLDPPLSPGSSPTWIHTCPIDTPLPTWIHPITLDLYHSWIHTIPW